MSSASRRLFSLLLVAALCTAAIPGFLLPAAASPGMPVQVVTSPSGQMPDENGSYESAFSDWLWQYDTAARRITYRGGWHAGYQQDGSGFLAYTHVNSSDQNWLTASTQDQWESPGGTINRTTLELRPHASDGYASGIGYTAEFGGVYQVSLDRYVGSGGDGFAIFLNDTMVFPTAGGSVGAAGDLQEWYYLEANTNVSAINAALSGLTLSCRQGDTISFVCKRGTGSGYVILSPRVTCSNAALSAGTSSSAGFGLPNFPTYTMQSSRYVLTGNFTDGWSFGSMPRSDAHAYTPFSALSETYCILSQGQEDQWTYGGLYLRTGVVITATNYVSAFSYRAPNDGEVDLRVNSLSAVKSASGEDILFCILHNGRMIWPQLGGSYTDLSSWYNLTATDADVTVDTLVNAGSLHGLAVKEGDLLQFCLTARSGNSMTAQDPAFSVAYQNITSTMPTPEQASSTLAGNYPRLNADGGNGSIASYTGRWFYEAAARGSAEFFRLTSVRGYRMLAGASEAEGYVGLRHNNADAACLSPGSKYDLSVSYEVRYKGRVTLSQQAIDPSGGEAVYDYILYRNGTPVITRKGTTSSSISALGYELDVEAGDILRFVLSSPSGAEAKQGLLLVPSVTYQALTDEICISGVSMTLSSGLAVNFYVDANLLLHQAEEKGLLIWRTPQSDYDAAEGTAIRVTEGVMQSDFGFRFTYTGIAAKEMTDCLYVRPYAVKNGTRIYGSVIDFSVVSYAEALYGRSATLDTLLTDMLLYGAAAQEYFDYHTERLATATLTEEQRASASTVAYLYNDARHVGEENQRNPALSRLRAFSLVLGERIAIRAYVDSDADEAASLELEVSEHYNMVSAVSYPVGADGSVTVDGMHAAEVGRLYYFRLRCERGGKTCYGPIVTYSVESYVAGCVDSERTGMVKLASSLINYGYSALAYAAMREP